MPSFDVVSEANLQEVKNAVDQVDREISTRFDFRGAKSSITLDEAKLLVVLLGDDKMKLAALQELLRQRLAKRGVSLKLVEFKDESEAAGGMLRQEVVIKQGLGEVDLKRLNKLIKESKLKVTSQIQGNQLRVTGKKRDDLQTVIAALKRDVQDLELQFTNFRD